MLFLSCVLGNLFVPIFFFFSERGGGEKGSCSCLVFFSGGENGEVCEGGVPLILCS